MPEATATAVNVLTGAVAFTDICGFTEFTAVQGDEDALRLLTAQEEVVRARLPAGARVVKELGDGLLLWFPEPVAAVAAAIDFQEGFQALEAISDLPLWVRVGMHWGSPTPRGKNDLIGHDVNIASRVVDVAGPSEVVITEALVDKLHDGEARTEFDLDELGPVVMKGLPEPVRLFRVS